MPILKLLQKIEEQGGISRFILWSQHYTDPKTRQRHCKKKKEEKIGIFTNIPGEDGCIKKKNQQSISKLNSTIYYRDHAPWSKGIYFGV